MINALANGPFGELSPWGLSFATHGDEDGALTFFDGLDDGVVAHAGFTDAGVAGMKGVLQSGFGPERVYGLMVTPLIRGEVEPSIEGYPAKAILERSKLALFRNLPPTHNWLRRKSTWLTTLLKQRRGSTDSGVQFVTLPVNGIATLRLMRRRRNGRPSGTLKPHYENQERAPYAQHPGCSKYVEAG